MNDLTGCVYKYKVLIDKINNLEKDNNELKMTIDDLKTKLDKCEKNHEECLKQSDIDQRYMERMLLSCAFK